MHLFTFAQMTSIRKVQVFPPHPVVAYRSCDQQSEENNFVCTHMLTHQHIYSPLCKGIATHHLSQGLFYNGLVNWGAGLWPSKQLRNLSSQTRRVIAKLMIQMPSSLLDRTKHRNRF